MSDRLVVEVGSAAPFGWDAWLGQLQEFFAAFPDGRHVIDEVLVDGSHGVSRCRFVGTHTGEFRGHRADGRQGVGRLGSTSTVSRATCSSPTAASSTCTGYTQQLGGG